MQYNFDNNRTSSAGTETKTNLISGIVMEKEKKMENLTGEIHKHANEKTKENEHKDEKEYPCDSVHNIGTANNYKASELECIGSPEEPSDKRISSNSLKKPNLVLQSSLAEDEAVCTKRLKNNEDDLTTDLYCSNSSKALCSMNIFYQLTPDSLGGKTSPINADSSTTFLPTEKRMEDCLENKRMVMEKEEKLESPTRGSRKHANAETKENENEKESSSDNNHDDGIVNNSTTFDVECIGSPEAPSDKRILSIKTDHRQRIISNINADSSKTFPTETIMENCVENKRIVTVKEKQMESPAKEIQKHANEESKESEYKDEKEHPCDNVHNIGTANNSKTSELECIGSPEEPSDKQILSNSLKKPHLVLVSSLVEEEAVMPKRLKNNEDDSRTDLSCINSSKAFCSMKSFNQLPANSFEGNASPINVDSPTEIMTEDCLENKIAGEIRQACTLPTVKQSISCKDLTKASSTILYVMKNEPNKELKIEKMQRIAEIIANRKTSLTFAVKILKAACQLSVNETNPNSTLKVLLRSLEIVNNYSVNLQYLNNFTDQVTDDILCDLNFLRKTIQKLKMDNENDRDNASAQCYLCTCAFQLAVKRYEEGNKNCNKALDLLNRMGNSVISCKKTMIGEVYLKKYLYFCGVGKEQEAEGFLEKSFDIFSSLTTSNLTDQSLANLFKLIMYSDIGSPRMSEGPLINFVKRVHEKIEKNTHWERNDSAKLLRILTLLPFTKILGFTEKFEQGVNDWKKIELKMPSARLADYVVYLSFQVLSFRPFPETSEFPCMIFHYMKDVILSIENVFKKFYLLSIYAPVLKLYDFSFSNFLNIYLNLFDSILWRIKEIFLIDEDLYKCYWVKEKLCHSLLYFSYFYAVIKDHQKCIKTVNDFFETFRAFSKKEENYDLLEASCHYLAAFSFFQTLEIDKAKHHLDSEIKLLNFQAKHVHRLKDAIANREYLENFHLFDYLSFTKDPSSLETLSCERIFAD